MCLSLASAQAAAAESDDTAARPEPVAAFIERCYDPIRLTGYPRLPVPGTDPGWAPADDSVRASLEVKMPGQPVFLRPAEGGGFLVFQFRQRVLVDAQGPDRNETRQSCRILYEGTTAPEPIYEALVDLFDGLDGTRSSRSIRGCGYDTPEGWKQWLWSDNPGKNDRIWKMYETGGLRGGNSGRSTCLFATTDRYYTAMDLVHVRLMAKESAPELIILEINRTFRPDRDAPEPKPRVTVKPLDNSADHQDDQDKMDDGG